MPCDSPGRYKRAPHNRRACVESSTSWNLRRILSDTFHNPVPDSSTRYVFVYNTPLHIDHRIYRVQQPAKQQTQT
uniref:Uncharacterized protein n=1 Tax=Spodoptera frugiperda ascovirus 1a TaxID=113370 RepID=Q9DKN0_SFAVA|nr:hypothetical protein [Spodoptera frugiperda ascovirus 1a]